MSDMIICEEPDINSPRIIASNMSTRGLPIRVISCYAPTEVTEDTDKTNIVYYELGRAIKGRRKGDVVFISSDINATTEAARSKTYLEIPKRVLLHIKIPMIMGQD